MDKFNDHNGEDYYDYINESDKAKYMNSGESRNTFLTKKQEKNEQQKLWEFWHDRYE